MIARLTALARPSRLARRGALLVGLGALAGCGGGYGSATNGGGITDNTPVVTTSVAISGFAFNPTAIQVAPGATVTFTNQDGTNHNVNFGGTGVTSIGDFPSGSRTAVMPTATGTYQYHCTLHSGMQGSIVVQ